MAWRSSSRGPYSAERLQEPNPISVEEIARLAATVPKISSTFINFIFFGIYALANTFPLNSITRNTIDYRQTIWLGKGASFWVSLFRLSRLPGTADIGLPESQVLVVKMPILNREATSISQDDDRSNERFTSIISELRALSHPPLRAHPNIVHFEGISWQRSLDVPALVVPCLLLEFAEYGTLADLLQREPHMPLSLQLSLLWDVALGLEALHKCGIAHGDIKPQNVLIFAHPKRRFIAKLGDFGFCLLDGEYRVWVGGTRQWMAPETQEPVSRELVPSTDLYSYGLLVWQVMLESESINSQLLSGSRQTTEQDTFLMKDSDMIIKKALRWSSELDCDRGPFLANIFKATLHRDPRERSLDSILLTFWGKDEDLELEDAMWRLFVNHEPQVRPQTIALIQRQLRNQREQVMAAMHSQGVETWALLRKPADAFSFLPTRIVELDPSLQKLVVEELENIIEERNSSLPVTPADAMAMLGFLNIINPFSRQLESASQSRGLDLLNKSAQNGSGKVQQQLYRLHGIFEQPLPDNIPFVNYAEEGVGAGLWDSVRDLAELDMARSKAMMELRRRCFITQDFIEEAKEILMGRSSGYQTLKTALSVQVVNYYPGNTKMDPINVAATCGFSDVVGWLIENGKADVNSRTEVMDTPLICAARQGHTSVLRILLRKGANPLLTNLNNENPLHFLWCFEEEYIDAVCALLISKGADVECQAHKHHLRLMEEWDTTHCSGTPLHRAVLRDNAVAVAALLRNGANPLTPVLDSSTLSESPVHFACRGHHAECLELLLHKAKTDLKHLRDWQGMPIRNLLLLVISEASENIQKHGRLHLQKKFKTMDILIHRGADIQDCDGIGTHAIIAAVTHGHRDVVNYLLKNGATPTLNQLRGHMKFSLLHLALEFGQIQMFRHLLECGADAQILAGENSELTVLHTLASGISGEEALKLAVDLVKFGVPIDGVVSDYETPLAVALRCSNFPLAKVLLRLGANPNASFRFSWNYERKFEDTILGSMVEHPNEVTLHQVSIFLDTAAPYHLRDLGSIKDGSKMTALELVAMERPTRPHIPGAFEPPLSSPAAARMHTRDDEACVKMADLLVRHFGLATTDANGRRALAYAAMCANLPVLKFLLSRGVDPAKPAWGQSVSALQWLLNQPKDDPYGWRDLPGAPIILELITLFQFARKPKCQVTSVSPDLLVKESTRHTDVEPTLEEEMKLLFPLGGYIDFDTAWEAVETAYENIHIKGNPIPPLLSNIIKFQQNLLDYVNKGGIRDLPEQNGNTERRFTMYNESASV